MGAFLALPHPTTPASLIVGGVLVFLVPYLALATAAIWALWGHTFGVGPSVVVLAGYYRAGESVELVKQRAIEALHDAYARNTPFYAQKQRALVVSLLLLGAQTLAVLGTVLLVVSASPSPGPPAAPGPPRTHCRAALDQRGCRSNRSPAAEGFHSI